MVNIKYVDSQAIDLKIQIIDMFGKQVYNTEFLTQDNMILDISNLDNGTYFFNISGKSSGSRTIKKLIKY